MRALVQRVSAASVTVDDAVVGEIGAGLLVLLGVTHDDDAAKADKLADKVTAAVAEGRSYRWIARDLAISKNTVLEIMKRHRQSAL